jgi:acetyl-CoA acetyltransferase family protein
MAIAIAAKQVVEDGMDVVVAGGVESISLTQNQHFNNYRGESEAVLAQSPHMYMPMIETAEVVARRYHVTREAQDRYALQSQQRVAAADQAGRFDAEIVPLVSRKLVIDKASGASHAEELLLKRDEGMRPDTTLEGLAKLRPAFKVNGTVTAGNASPYSDGAAAVLLMTAERAKELGLKPLARFITFAAAGVEPDVMGVGPIKAVPKALKRAGIKLEDVKLIEFNEAFAAQVVAVVRELGFDESKVNVNGGAIALGHPLGATGAKLTTQLVHELGERGGGIGLVTMCIGGGMGAAGLFEVYAAA